RRFHHRVLRGRGRGGGRADRLGDFRLPRPAPRARRSRGARRHAPLRRDQGARMSALPQDNAQDEMQGEAPRRLLLVRLAVLVPLAIFLAIVAVFWSGLFSGRDPSLLPSVLIGHPAPQTPLPPVEGLVR